MDLIVKTFTLPKGKKDPLAKDFNTMSLQTYLYM